MATCKSALFIFFLSFMILYDTLRNFQNILIELCRSFCKTRNYISFIWQQNVLCALTLFVQLISCIYFWACTQVLLLFMEDIKKISVSNFAEGKHFCGEACKSITSTQMCNSYLIYRLLNDEVES